MLYHQSYYHGGDIYQDTVSLDFSVNTNPLGVPQSVIQAIRDAADLVEHYPDPFCRKLVQAIHVSEQVPQEYILCGNGAAELIYSFCAAAKAEQAIQTAPTFSEYALGCKAAGCKMLSYPLKRENGFLLDERILDFIKEQHAQVVFLCNPNNPDGRNIEPALLERILLLCAERNMRLFVDECFLDLSDHAESMSGYLSAYPQLFILKAFTKNYAIAGVRLGYCLSSDKQLLTRMSETVQPWNVSVIAQEAGVAALKEKAFIEKARILFRTERPRMLQALTDLGFMPCPSDANYILFQGDEDLGQWLSGKQIALRCCSDYPGLGPGWYRVSIRLPEENNRLLEALQEYQRSS